MSGAEIYDLENNKVYKSSYNSLLDKWSYEIDYDTNMDVLQYIIDKYHFGRYITNTVTGKTFFVSKEVENLVKIVNPINIDFNESGLELNQTTNKLSVKTNINNGVIINSNNEVDLSFLQSHDENGIKFKETISVVNKRMGPGDNTKPNSFSICGMDAYRELAISADPVETYKTNNAVTGSQLYLHGSKAYLGYSATNVPSTSDGYLPGQFGIHASGYAPVRDTNGKLIKYDSTKTADSNYITSTYLSKTLKGSPEGDLVWNGTAMQVTSDERKKANINKIPDKVLEAWKDVNWIQFNYREELGTTRMRLHTGLIAQAINRAFEKHGLKATDYGLVVFDELSDLWNVRYEEAQAMEAAYQRKRADDLEKRLEKLETLMAGNK